MRYTVVIEKGERNYSACMPDLPGCVSTGDTLEEVNAEIREAIEFHLAGMREDGAPIPRTSSQAEYVEVGRGRRDECYAGLFSFAGLNSIRDCAARRCAISPEND